MRQKNRQNKEIDGDARFKETASGANAALSCSHEDRRSQPRTVRSPPEKPSMFRPTGRSKQRVHDSCAGSPCAAGHQAHIRQLYHNADGMIVSRDQLRSTMLSSGCPIRYRIALSANRLPARSAMRDVALPERWALRMTLGADQIGAPAGAGSGSVTSR